MVNVEKAKLRGVIELFYLNKQSKDKKKQTYHHFKCYKHNGDPIYSKPQLYALMQKLDETGSLKRKIESERPIAMRSGDQKKL